VHPCGHAAQRDAEPSGGGHRACCVHRFALHAVGREVHQAGFRAAQGPARVPHGNHPR
ncbi:unnamed protein product, partial [Effrenium voratum]